MGRCGRAGDVLHGRALLALALLLGAGLAGCVSARPEAASAPQEVPPPFAAAADPVSAAPEPSGREAAASWLSAGERVSLALAEARDDAALDAALAASRALRSDAGALAEALEAEVLPRTPLQGPAPEAEAAAKVRAGAEALARAEREAVLRARGFPLAPSSETRVPPGALREEDRRFLASFDADGSGSVQVAEAVVFFAWTERNVPYRYDDERAKDPVRGALVGDGRRGTDHRQEPWETLAERAGDCEDTSTLDVAFFRGLGHAAYVGFVNLKKADGYDHAVALVRVHDLEELATALGRVHAYRLPEGNPYGVPAGDYLVVDHTNSKEFGVVTGRIRDGHYRLVEVRDMDLTRLGRVPFADAPVPVLVERT